MAQWLVTQGNNQFPVGGMVDQDARGRSHLRRTKIAEGLGTVSNLEIAAYVYAFLTTTGERLSRIAELVRRVNAVGSTSRIVRPR